MLDKAPKLNRIEMVRSDVSGKLFPSSECEIIIIKIVKGKDEDINDYSPFGRKEEPKRELREVDNHIFNGEVNTGRAFTPVLPSIPDTDSPEFNNAIKRKNAVIPAALRGVFDEPMELRKTI